MSRQTDDALVLHLAFGHSIEEAARLAGVSRATAFRRMQNPKFRERINKARSENLERAYSNLSSGSVEASIVLRTLVSSKNEKIKLAATQAMLSLGLKMRESVDLARQLAELKAQVERLHRGDRRRDAA